MSAGIDSRDDTLATATTIPTVPALPKSRGHDRDRRCRFAVHCP